jgi:hypothetical protein
MSHRLRFLVVAAVLAGCGDALAPPGEPGTPPDPDRAAYVPSDTLFSAVAVGRWTGCGLTRAGRALCWGVEGDASLGGTAASGACPDPSRRGCALSPVAVDSSLRFVQLSAAGTRTCGLTPSGKVWCWAGTGTAHGPWPVRSTSAYARVVVSPLPGGDDATCAITADGRVDCWEWWSAVAATPASRPGADAVPFGGAVRFRALGSECGVTTDGGIACWNVVDTTAFAVAGVPHDTCSGGGSLGRYSYACHYPPVKLLGSSGWAHTGRTLHECAITTAERLACWQEILSFGDTLHAAAFAGGRRPRPTAPAELLVPEPVRDAFAMLGGVCARAASGRLYCVGQSYTGEFGNVPSERADVPTLAAGGRAFVAVDGTWMHACGVTADGALLCWGSNVYGEAGVGRSEPLCGAGYACVPSPTRIASVAGVK